MTLTADHNSRERARPLAPGDRREAILDAVLPLLRQHGRDVSTRQLAEAAGVAEGTLFRAFGDKESLLEAAVAKLLDPSPLIADLRAIDASLPLERKLAEILAHVRARFSGIFRVMALLGINHRPPAGPDQGRWIETVCELLAPHEHELSAPPRTVAYWLRMSAFASTLPSFNDPYEFTTDELAHLITSGVACSDGRAS
ncbi:TetR/AcrR family transcriptional regulator [Naasia sp. SYSU D00948]|uniref:TetR/AcrR family transcriptional regulator n=1 Tax=Naasia sp. SYSU D00948 TaxID=2817379 RepID=UPI001B316428|nr:TetR/AcrR family transcriptional regulator [Naasia sp. SYSU D00948]